MREIKFRAWDKEEKVMVFTGGMAITLAGELLVVRKESGVWIFEPADEDLYELMQFTGLHDKNGKEIYEGDIVRVLYDEDFMGKDKDTNCEVRYEEKLAMFVLDDGSGLTPDCFETDAELTVVGNVFENPELAGRTE